MASPQKENGYTPIANEILEVLPKISLNGTQYRILFVVWRYTYGFNRKEHELSENFISKAIDCDRRQVRRELNNLINYKIISVKKEATFKNPRLIEFNKNYNEWVIERPQRVKKYTEGELVPTRGGELVPLPEGELVPQERKKDNIKDKGIFASTLDDFIKMRKLIKKPMTDRAIKMLITKLDKLADTEESKIAILEQSILNSWQDVYELKNKPKQQEVKPPLKMVIKDSY